MNSRFLRNAKKVMSGLLTTTFICASIMGNGLTVYAQTGDGEVLGAFKNPDYMDKPMARMWFPDAGAGLDEYDTIEKQINALADGGWGGVEVTMLANATQMDNDDAKIVGWGTPAWKKLLKKVLKAANEVESGFNVDITITDHWPTIINSVDPNDDAASQEVSYTYTKISEDDLSSTDFELELPETKLYDNLSTSEAAPFIFADKFVSASLVKVDSVDDGAITYNLDSVIDLTGSVYSEGGHSAGVPDSDALGVYYGDTDLTNDDLIRLWGDEPAEDADLSESYNGKMDSDQNRARMADWQYYYYADLTGAASELNGYTASSGDDIQAGDYVLVNVYRRGTGQVLSEGMYPSVQMYGRTYTTNYFSKVGVDVITQYWEDNILDDELRELLEENGGSIFEDSLEASTSSSFWSYNLLDELGDTYQYKTKLPLIVALGSSSFDDSDLASSISTDYSNLLGNLYETKHLEPIQEWADTFNYTYRAQAYGLTGVDEASAATVVDIPEGDNAMKGDGLRLLAGSKNIAGHEYLSMEAVTGMDNMKINWADIITELNQNYSDGVNHVVLHGTPYSKSYNGYYGTWPGWVAFDSAHCGSYTYRQAYWEDVNSLADYMARVQSIMSKGNAKIDLAVMGGEESGNGFQEILDKGYSYNLLGEGVIKLDSTEVSDNLLNEYGPGYKALILNEISTLSVEGVEKLIEFADDGLPIILYNTNPTSISGTDTTENNVDDMISLFNDLEDMNTVYTAESEDDILDILDDLSITSDASYDQSALEATHYEDEGDGSDYYYLFNNPYPENNGMVNAGQNESYKSGDLIETDVTLKGDGTPYMLNAWTGEVTPIADYAVNSDGTITANISVSGGDAIIIGIINDSKNYSYVTEKTGGEVIYEDGKVVFRSNTPGTYSVTLSDGTQSQAVVDNELEDLDLSEEGWDLELQSFGPDYSDDNLQDYVVEGLEAEYGQIYKDPSASVITTVNFENIALGDWSDLPVTQDQLDEMGVGSIDDVAGIGYYTKTFTLPDGWSDTTGAILNLGYSQDQVTKVSVNGNTIDNINIVSDKVDIGKYLVTGENTITIKLDTPLFNRAKVEHYVYTTGMMTYNSTPIDVGLLSATLSPYTQIDITGTEELNITASFTVGGTENASSLEEDKMLDTSTVVTNSGSEDKEALLIVALYNSEGTMVNVSYLSKVVEANSTEDFHAGFKLPSDITGYTAKAFVWDGESMLTSQMTPLSNVIQITD